MIMAASHRGCPVVAAGPGLVPDGSNSVETASPTGAEIRE